MSERILFRDVKPYDTPTTLHALQGPAGGILELPLAAYWGPNPVVDLDTFDGVDKAYTALISNGRTSDQEALMNRERLIKVWPELALPARAQSIWESRFPELQAS